MMEEIRIRPAREEDCPRILELIRELAVYEKMEEQVTADSETLRASVFDRKMAGIFVAQAGENVVGYALYCHNFSTFDCSNGILFTIKNSCRTFMHHHFFHYGRTFDHTAVRCQISF